MDDETRELSKTNLGEVAKARQYSQLPTPNYLFISAETISGLAYLIGPMMDLETPYRQEIVANMAEGDSHAKAEAKARAGTAYGDWKKLEQLYELAKEQVMLIKKFNNLLEAEHRGS